MSVACLIFVYVRPTTRHVWCNFLAMLSNVGSATKSVTGNIHHQFFSSLLSSGCFCFQDIVLKAGKALTIFAFNNTPQQYAIREAGGIKYSVFQDFIDSDNDFYKCSAAFQVRSEVKVNYLALK